MAKAVTPEEAQALMAEGHTYVDVRSEPEFEAGHPAGAVNVPLSNMGPGGLEPNADFMTVMERAFPKDAKLVIGCKTGARSRRAAAMLEAAGYTSIADMVAGFAGARDAFGRPNPGWTQKALPVDTGAPAGKSYADVKKR
ncbi:MAG TPA: rhodanese-like domain-containing protein [Polyangiaceae bacterium]|nr:rhodanese-like domain-containing protein [Polyangiaceae bacterium]